VVKLADVGEVGRTIITGLIVLFVLGIVGYVFFILIGAHVAPVFKHLLSGTGYEGYVDMGWNIFKVLFIVIVIAVFGYVIVKLFFEREPSVQGYYTGGY